MKKCLIPLFLIVCACLEGNIEKYFKPVLFKEPQNSNPIEHVDFAYIINLDQRPEKFERTIHKLAPYNIFPCRFSAVNGWELSLETINKLGVKWEPWVKNDIIGTCYFPDDDYLPHHELMHVEGRNYFSHGLSPGAIGIVLSHLSVLQDAYDSGYNTIWVMEDDIEVIRNPNILSFFIEQLDEDIGKNNWDILFTDRDTKDKDGNYVTCSTYARRPNFTPQHPERFQMDYLATNDLRRIGARYGAYSMIVRRSGMKKLLSFYKKYKIFLPYDMDFTMPEDIAMYTVLEDVVSTQIDALTDNGRANYKKESQPLFEILSDYIRSFLVQMTSTQPH